ncbi:MAG: transposase [Polyangiaceae bacterium]
MTDIFEKFTKKAPVAVMARALLEFALEPAALDALFVKHAERQYPKKLLFSTMLDLAALVVCRVQPSVRAAYRAMRQQVPVSLTALYDKLGGIEVATTEALVAHSAARLRPVRAACAATEPWLPGYRIRVLDGNHLAATERRLAVLRGCAAGPLPGHSLVVLEPEVGLVVQIVACEDGHAQERTLLAPILAAAEPGDVYIADRNFCTLGFLFGLSNRPCDFIIRQHASLPVESRGTLRRCGRAESGEVFEQGLTVRMDGAELHLRRIVIRLDTPTRDGDREMAILTALPPSVRATRIADLYRRRWTIETFFAHVERNLQSEIAALGYPKAALFGFGVALVAANVFAVVHAAMQTAQGHDEGTAPKALSEFAIINAARSVHDGMDLVLDDEVWEPFRTMVPRAFATCLVGWAANSDWPRFRKAVRGPKKSVPKRTRFTDKPHVSTARLLAE